ncbi:sushi, von Willebrand factor type A, EGF and pentraxin domain-containing protein 1 [Lingula anatina]|uniref:Sushi, von Willebrand factor type A, EGF and pentraxin domain-containing protein 1 n=1 Tax=Lingula anatina TaxID=7574 RepID=A0A1S3HCI7_LINAN|nr:sushi, von Willebrand factor type A, EGF and pentraxin domain-containing protein 1 [Lingula anatina]|eukprot:XP_013383226.1 sushi, von Willebrand factor type A, EGF and pentraxin domain-containing protein 1 [Lingula anatina]
MLSPAVDTSRTSGRRLKMFGVKVCMTLLWLCLLPGWLRTAAHVNEFLPLRNNIQTLPQHGRKKVEVLGETLKRQVSKLRQTANQQVDLVFLVDSSGSVGEINFFNELKFVKKLLADFTVAEHATRVAVVTFSSASRIERHVDHLTRPTADRHKCSLLEEDLPKISFTGGGTYTLGAMEEAKEILAAGRQNSSKAVILITDGYSNNGDPRPVAKALRDQNTKVFTFGIRNGNTRELREMASEPKDEHSYILDSFEEFEALARRALHEDLQTGGYVTQDSEKCDNLCEEGKMCCDSSAACRCGIHTGHYQCVCDPGFYGNGLQGDCKGCPSGTYKNTSIPGDESTCTPCPDPNHVTPVGSTKIQDCTCKKGFRTFGEFGCAVLTCPDIAPPGNGYFVKGQCSNEFNAACGGRCAPGYQMLGSSVRLCQEDGTWSGTDISCNIKKCTPLKPPRGGRMVCTKNDFNYQTKCKFSCDKGYELLGSSKRTCLAIAVWNGIPTKCREVQCPPLPELKDGYVVPAACTTEPASYGVICTISCEFGYTLVGPYTRQCNEFGKWKSSSLVSKCVDTTEPSIMCPDDITVVADDHENTAEVTWEVPVAIDNSGYVPTVTVVPAVVPPRKFQIGRTKVTYHAEDLNKNRAKCSFVITVKDEEPPRLDRCISPPPVVSTQREHYVEWVEPLFSDNSQEDLTIKSSHKPGMFKLGKTEVFYTAYDPSGNKNNCTLEIIVQEHKCTVPPSPVNGNVNCKENQNNIHCTLSCMDGYGFAIVPPESYSCHFDEGRWSPSDKMPDCSEKKMSNNVIQPARITYKTNVCADRLLLNELENDLQSQLSNKVAHICEENVICGVENTEGICEEYDNKIRNPFSRLSRRKRDDSITKVKFTFQVRGFVNTTKSDHAQHSLMESIGLVKRNLKTEARQGQLDIMMGDQPLHFEDIEFLLETPKFVCEPGSVLRKNVCVNCPVGTFFNVVTEECESCSVGTYQTKEGQQTCLVCPNKTSTATNNSKSLGECKAQCLPGSVSYDGLEICETCEIGYYQAGYAQTSCDKCPGRKTTWRRGTRKAEECKDRCPAGEVSKTGLMPCFPCPKGFFQPEEGSSFCRLCPNKATTNHTGSTNITDCEGIKEPDIHENTTEVHINECFLEPCQNRGQCQSLKIGYTCQCLPGYTGTDCETEIDECQSRPCQNNGTCQDFLNYFKCTCLEGFTGESCETNIDDCQNAPCWHGGLCTDLINSYKCSCKAGYTGQNCSIDVNECASSPCQNNGNCLDHINRYSCLCPFGFTGDNCETDIDECASGPCVNGGTCQDGHDSFVCLCQPGYAGRLCSVNVDECSSQPCRHGGTCYDSVNSFTCICPPSFTGNQCQTELSTFFQLNFGMSGTLDHSIVHGPHKDLSEITVAFWMKTSDKDNYGTAISYSTLEENNTFAITDYSGFVIYVNGQDIVTDVTANDDQWHHICVTWSSANGEWQIFRDGRSLDQGQGLAPGTVIKGGGKLVLGQEQDAFGGGFSALESFVGSMTQLHIWDKVFTDSEIQGLILTCEPYIGNVKSWPDFLSGLRGKVQKTNSSFCKDCEIPPFIPNGSVEWTGTATFSSATYSCDVGYELKGTGTRRCQVYSEWDGEAPRCEKVSCGFPGMIPNGYIAGSWYTYGNFAQYVCVHRYKLVGNATIYCNEHGVWEGNQPICELVLCKLPKIPDMVEALERKEEYRPGDVARFYCNPGYMLKGPTSVHCDDDGSWDVELPSCVSVKCDLPPRLDNGIIFNVSSQDFSMGTIVTYRCEVGYSLIGKSKIKCNFKGKWDKDPPSCTIVKCRKPPSLQFGRVEGKSFVFGSKVTYHCDTGYKLIGRQTLKCNADGQWGGSSPICDPVYCDVPQQIQNGFVHATSYAYNATVHYTCRTGHMLFGNKMQVCLRNGSWSGSIPVCEPIPCLPPSPVANAKIIGEDFTFGSTVTYECQEGYILEGIPERVCREDATWHNPQPSCKRVQCKVPDIAHGILSKSVLYYQDELLLNCKLGFELSHNETVTCLANGTWSSLTPTCEPITCHRPHSILYGIVFVSSTSYGAVANYTCNPGFELHGDSTRLCLTNRKWSGTEPACTIIKCPHPEDIDYGEVKYANLSFGLKAHYSCSAGYELVGKSSRTCQANKTWSGKAPNCVQVYCPRPPSIQYGNYKLDDTVYGSIAQYECFYGFVLKGDVNRTCEQDKTWSGSEPICFPKQCKSLPSAILNGKVIGTNYTFNATVTFECDTGYMLIGSKFLACLGDGTWDFAVPVCIPIFCPDLPSFANGKVDGKDTIVFSSVSYTCDKGYKLMGPSQRNCLENGTWSKVDPICEPVDCGHPENILNGRVIVSGTKFHDFIEYECNIGYTLVGVRSRLCSASGVWENVPPACNIISCGQPTQIQNGKLHYNHTTYGSFLTYTCTKGYQLVGHKTRICNEHGRWSSEEPVCKITTCKEPEYVRNSDYVVTGTTFGATVTYSCMEGYVLVGNKHRTCSFNGKWVPNAPECEIISCPELSPIENGYAEGAQYTFSSRVAYHCHPGYELIGSRSIICLSNATWSAPSPMCQRIMCSYPPELKHGEMTGDHGYGGHMLYKCNSGYRLVGDYRRECLADGTWSVTAPICEPLKCSKPTIPDGYVNGQNFILGSIIQYGCNTNFELIGNDTRECLENQTWSGVAPFCEVIRCSVPKAVANGMIMLNGYKVGEVAEYKCNNGYEIIGSAKRTCQNDKTWSGSDPSCGKIFCPHPEQIENGIFSTQSTAKDFPYDILIEYSCLRGYYIIGVSQHRCLANKTWSGDLPYCQPIDCEQPPIDSHLQVSVESTTYKSTANYSCDDGYILIGNATQTCMDNKTWSGDIPRCDIVTCPTPSHITNGKVSGNLFLYGEQLQYECDIGYELFGSSSLTCLSNGQWSDQYPTCLKVSCTVPVASKRSVLLANTSTLFYGDSITYSCVEGFSIHGDSTRKCKENGQWSGTEPKCEIVKCGKPLHVSHGGHNGSHFSYSEIIEFYCDKGYEMVGSPIAHCLSNGKWSSMSPVCVMVTCPMPNEIENGELLFSSNMYGGTVEYMCHEGFELIGNKSHACQADKTWSGNIPYCEQIMCPHPEDPPNGHVITSDLSYGQVVGYACNPGFELNGVRMRQCVGNGIWSEEAPNCTIISCPPLTKISHGTIQGNKTHFGSSVSYSCEMGFEISGPSVRSCTEHGTWSDKTPKCIPIKCQEPGLLANGKIYGNNFTYGEVIKFRCQTGYTLKGPSSSQCKVNKQWSGKTPICTVDVCETPTKIPHGKIIGDNFTFSATIAFICDPGYRLEGSSVRQCIAKGKWSGKTPSCRPIACIPPPSLDNGYIIGENFTYGQVVQYVCNSGYNLHGPSEKQCQEDRTWTGGTPSCSLVTCSVPLPIPHGNILGEKYYFNETIEYRCAKGYELKGSPFRRCLTDGNWSGNEPKCSPVSCGIPDPVPNGYFNGTEYTFHKVVHYSCLTGYKLAGVPERTCLPNKQWSGENPTCTIVSCPKPADLQNGVLFGEEYVFGSAISYMCEKGYKLEGSHIMYCQQDGTWTGSSPVCTLVTCPVPEALNNGLVFTKNYSYKSILMYKCNQGFELIGSKQRHCLENGTWSFEKPYCKKVTCNHPSELAHGNVFVYDYSYESVIEYRCDYGYEIKGNILRTCQADKTWSGNTPKCELLVCPTPPVIANAIVVGENFSFAESITYVCNKGFELRGHAIRTCQADKTWSRGVTQCIPLTCPQPPPFRNGWWVATDNNTVHSVIRFQCNVGYSLSGPHAIHCLTSKQWSGEFPTCNKITCGPPDKIKNGLVVGASYEYDEVVEYRCLSGHFLSGPHKKQCQADGTWEPSGIPKCDYISCGRPRNVQNAKVIGTSYAYDDYVFYLCTEGFELMGNNVLECGRDGRWRGRLPVCKMISCGPPPVIANASTYVTHYTYGSRVSYSCNKGFLLQGESMAECMANGTWMFRHSPSCVPVSCGQPDPLYNGRVHLTDTTYGSIASYTCKKGHVLVGSQRVTCKDNGFWSHGVPTCKRVVCRPPPRVLNADAEGHDFTFGGTLRYSCIPGYEMVGQNLRMCQEDGSWEGEQPYCKKKSCGGLSPLKNGRVVGRGSLYLDRVRFFCDSGHILVGNESAICLETGQWSSKVPVCSADMCPPPRVSRQFRPVSGTFAIGSTVGLACISGYVAKGDITITCQKNKRWSSPSGTCERVYCGPPKTDEKTVQYIFARRGDNYTYRDRVVVVCKPGLAPGTHHYLTCRENGKWDGVAACKEVTCAQKCKNGGTCVGRNKCSCRPGFKGEHCEQAICVLPCMHGGTCVAPYRCTCKPGYTGTRCEKAICSQPCANGGQCIEPEICQCMHGWMPPYCEEYRHDWRSHFYSKRRKKRQIH